MTLPNFLIIGAMKAGTSSLYHYLRGHPQVFMPARKEPQFFAKNWERGPGWYESLFEDAGSADAIGEASTDYTKHPDISGVPERISKLLPSVRMIYLVRHPIERMTSEYHHRVSSPQRWERGRSVEEALLTDPSYCNASKYAMQIEQYLQHFYRGHLLVLKSEDLRERRKETLGRVFDFLRVDARWEPSNLGQEFHASEHKRQRRAIDYALRNAPGYRFLAAVAPPPLKKLKYRWTTVAAPPKPTLSVAVCLELEDRLRDDVRRLRQYMGGDFDGWGIT